MSARWYRVVEPLGVDKAEAVGAEARTRLASAGAATIWWLGYAPARLGFGHVDAAGALCDRNGPCVAPWFELRIFGPTGEVRWLQEGPGRGRAVLIRESNDAGEGGRALEARHEIDYLLWGQLVPGSEGADGWCKMATARIGTVCVPHPRAADDGRLRLRAIEHHAIGDDHGNVVVIGERLSHLHDEPGAECRGGGGNA